MRTVAVKSHGLTRLSLSGKVCDMTDYASIDRTDIRDDMTPAELEEYYAAEAERYDPDNPYADISEDDLHALDCPHLSLIIGVGNSRDCEDCGQHFR